MTAILIDKLVKLQIVDCGVLIAWIFSDDLREEIHRFLDISSLNHFFRQWVWEMLNTILRKLSRDVKNAKSDLKELEERIAKTEEELNQEEEESEAATNKVRFNIH